MTKDDLQTQHNKTAKSENKPETNNLTATTTKNTHNTTQQNDSAKSLKDSLMGDRGHQHDMIPGTQSELDAAVAQPPAVPSDESGMQEAVGQQPDEKPIEPIPQEQQESTQRDELNKTYDNTEGIPRADQVQVPAVQQHLHNQLQKQQRQARKSAMAAPQIDQPIAVSADYLAQLIKDKKQLSVLPAVFIHVQRLIDEEINKVRQSLFQLNDVVHPNEPLELPEPEGEIVLLQEKIYVPVSEHPDYNFVGRLLGPRGMTAKQLEQETGCKIMIRGRGSMRDKKKEEQNRGKTNWEHLNDELHVLITVEDTQNRAQVKLKRALEEVRQLLVPIVDGEDELKKRQLMELAIINGTYRDCNYNDALTKMLNDVVYRQKLGEPIPVSSQQQQQQQQHQMVVAMANGSPINHQRHFGHHYVNHSAMNGSSISSGVPSTGSNTPNSVHGHHHTHQEQQQHQMNVAAAAAAAAHAHHHQAAAAVGAAAAAAAAAQQHSVSPHLGSASTTAAVVAAAAAAAAAQHNITPQSPINPHHIPHPHHAGPVPPTSHHPNHMHPHHPQSSAVAAAAAAAALMANSGDANALIYAQQYHDFHHYAAMAAAAQPLLAVEYPHAPPHSHPIPHPHHPTSQQQQQHLIHHYQQQVESDHQAALAYQHQMQLHQQHQHPEVTMSEAENGNETSDQPGESDSGQQKSPQAQLVHHQVQSHQTDLCG